VISHLTNKLNSFERKQRERNFRLAGVEELRGEDCHELVRNILNYELCMNPINPLLEVVHRTGKFQPPRSRLLICRVSDVRVKYEVLARQREAIRHRPYFIVDDLTRMDYEEKMSSKPEKDRYRRSHQHNPLAGNSMYQTRPRMPPQVPLSQTHNHPGVHQQYPRQNMPHQYSTPMQPILNSVSHLSQRHHQRTHH
jgi:hypothetical protein